MFNFDIAFLNTQSVAQLSLITSESCSFNSLVGDDSQNVLGVIRKNKSWQKAINFSLFIKLFNLI